MDAELRSLSRKAWGDLETLHVVGYFAPEVTEEYVDLGLHPQLAYFPARAAVFGEAGPGLTVATFYVSRRGWSRRRCRRPGGPPPRTRWWPRVAPGRPGPWSGSSAPPT